MMKMEELLSSLPQPEADTEAFRLRLRRSLIDSHRYQRSIEGIYRTKFYVSVIFAFLFFSLSAAFIVMPDFPDMIHYALLGPRDGDLKSFETFVAHSTRKQQTSSESKQNPLEEESHSWLKSQVDEEFVRYIAENLFQSSPGGIQPANEDRLYAIREFKMDNGRRALVYTTLSNQPGSERESY